MSKNENLINAQKAKRDEFFLRELSRMSNSFLARDSQSFRHSKEKEREKVDRTQEKVMTREESFFLPRQRKSQGCFLDVFMKS